MWSLSSDNPTRPQSNDIPISGPSPLRFAPRDSPIPPELRPLQELARLNPPHELLLGHEMILPPVLLSRTRGAGRVRDGEAEGVGVRGEEAGEEGGLAGARGPADDEGLGGQRGKSLGGLKN